MKEEYEDLILKVTGAEALHTGAKIQTLWSGYGEIVRVHLQGSKRSSAVLKHIVLPQEPRNTTLSHQRKVKSYQVEMTWYKNYSTNDKCRIPECLAAGSFGNEQLIVLEDLDLAGFDLRKNSVDVTGMESCLSWLANFHGRFMGAEPQGLWQTGTYWHLETRPEELEAMADKELKSAAQKIDGILSGCRFKTIVHGDAKLANFCFSGRLPVVAAVDFQYVGGGCGMKDVAYFLGSCMQERECERLVPGLLDHYFKELKAAVDGEVNFAELESEWRAMFVYAWTDFYRFLLGWMPTHRKNNSYSRKLAKEVLRKI